MIYFAKSINGKDFFPISLDSKKEGKTHILMVCRELGKRIFKHKNSESSLTTNFLFRTPYANECESVHKKYVV